MYEVMETPEAEDGATVLVLTFNDSGSKFDYELDKEKVDLTGVRRMASYKYFCGIAHWWDAADRIAQEDGIQMQIRRQELTLAAAFLSRSDCERFLARMPTVLKQEIIEGSLASRSMLKQGPKTEGGGYDRYHQSHVAVLCEEYGLTLEEMMGADYP